MKHQWIVWVAAGALASVACDNKGSLGEYPSGSGSGDDGAESGGDDGVTSTSGATNGQSGGQSGNASDAGIETEDAGDESPLVLDVGGMNGECEAGCPIECEGEECGPLGQHDEGGCLRRPCQDDDPCDDGQRCYIPSLFGGCVSSGWSCELSDGACLCGGDADCGGGYCVDEDDYPQAAAGPEGASQIVNGCAPNDGPAKDLAIGLSDGMCGGTQDDLPLVRLTIYDLDPGETGTYSLGNGGASEGHGIYTDAQGANFSVYSGSVAFTEYAGFAAGSYEIWVGDIGGGGETMYVAGDFDLAEDCGGDPGCG
ncbi:MAG: hypothetical protein AAF721_26070 [Myxococcota bacterium]